MTETLAKNGVRITAQPDHQAKGRGMRQTNGHGSSLSPEDAQLWREAFDEARGQGAGPDVARVFANQTLAYLLAERDGVDPPGSSDIQPYR